MRVAHYARAVQDDLMTVTRSVELTSPSDLGREHLEFVIEVGRRMSAATLYPYAAPTGTAGRTSELAEAA